MQGRLIYGILIVQLLQTGQQEIRAEEINQEANATVQQADEQQDEQQCDYVHDRCAFIVSTGRSGSTALMAAMNQIDGIFIRGENNGMFQEVESLRNLLYALSVTYKNPKTASLDAESAYFKFIRRQKPAWYNHFPDNAADCISKYIFKYLYGRDKFDNYLVGFKEIRFRQNDKPVMMWNERKPPQGFHPTYVNSYEIFESRMKFLKTLCKRPQIILNIRKNVTATMHSDFYNKQQEHAESLPQLQEYIIRYHRQHLNETFMVHYEDMYNSTVNATLAHHLMQFLRVDPDAYNISFVSVKPNRR